MNNIRSFFAFFAFGVMPLMAMEQKKLSECSASSSSSSSSSSTTNTKNEAKGNNTDKVFVRNDLYFDGQYIAQTYFKCWGCGKGTRRDQTSLYFMKDDPTIEHFWENSSSVTYYMCKCGYAAISDVCVCANLRKQGIGTEMLKYTKKKFIESGITAIGISARPITINLKKLEEWYCRVLGGSVKASNGNSSFIEWKKKDDEVNLGDKEPKVS